MGHEKIIKNKKGSLVLRDIMFMLIIFSAFMAIASLFVLSMANEYLNTDMINDYYSAASVGNLGNVLFGEVNESVTVMQNKLPEAIGSFQLITGAIKGIGAIFISVVAAPLYIQTAITKILFAVGLPYTISMIVGNLILFLIYAVIVFVIVSAFLRGGKV